MLNLLTFLFAVALVLTFILGLAGQIVPSALMGVVAFAILAVPAWCEYLK